MAAAWVERRLAAILAADVVGYSRLVEKDEAGTLSVLKALRREVIDPLLAEHHGRIVKLMGDGALAEFGSVVDAVACAVAVQKRVAERQAEVGAESVVSWRITVRAAREGDPRRPRPEQRFRMGARLFRIEAVAESGSAGQWLDCIAREERYS